DRSTGTGAGRSHDDEVPHGQIRPYPIIQSAVFRRPGMGDAGCGRTGNGRPSSGNEDLLPFPAHAGKHGTVTGTEPDRALFIPSAGAVSEGCGEDIHWDRLRSV